MHATEPINPICINSEGKVYRKKKARVQIKQICREYEYVIHFKIRDFSDILPYAVSKYRMKHN